MHAISHLGLGVALTLGAVLTTACSGTASPGAQAAPEAGITLPAAPAPDTSSGSTSGVSQTLEGKGQVDPLADLDIDDQRGDGTSVVVESLTTGLLGVELVLVDEQGQTLVTMPVKPGVQPVTVELWIRLERSQEVRGMLMAPDGSGILIDDDGEAVEEDFDYVIR